MKRLVPHVDYSARSAVSVDGRTYYLVTLFEHMQARPLAVFRLPDHEHFAQLSYSSNHSVPFDALVIINHYLAGSGDLLMCQDELIDRGYAEIARI